MGRPQVEIDLDILTNLLVDGASKKDAAKEMGVSAPTLRRIIQNSTDKKPLLGQYKTLRNLHLTELQVQILEAVTPDKIADADLDSLMRAYKVLRVLENDVIPEGAEGNMKGLVAHLLHLERLEREKGRPLLPEDIPEAEIVQECTVEESDGNGIPIPQLPDPEIKFDGN